MSDTQRCEPADPTVDGWHWLTYPDATDEPAHWQASNQSWLLSGHDDYVTPDFMRLDESSTRYLSPVAPPAVVRGLVEALEGAIMGMKNPGTLAAAVAMEAARLAINSAKEAGL